MAHSFRNLRSVVAKRLADAVQRVPHCSSLLPSWNDQLSLLAWCIRFCPVSKRSNVSNPQISVSFQRLRDCGLLDNVSLSQINSIAHEVTQKCDTNNTLRSLSVNEYGFTAAVDSSLLSKIVLSKISSESSLYGHNSDLYDLVPSSSGMGISSHGVSQHQTNQTIVVDFSSPNIAKPFHAGHLRSTILGNFISNICESFKQNVVKINYLGDWGTQFGLLGVGFEKYGDSELVKADPITHLSEVYVKINKEVAVNNAVHALGMQYFQKMEQNDAEALRFWSKCREISLSEYNDMYRRLNIDFTHIHSESMYREKAAEFVKEAVAAGIITIDSKTGVGYIDLTASDDKSPVHGNLVKSDGTTLYLTRDVVAALDRWETFSAHKLYYVVENGHHQHFSNLIRVLSRLGHDWASAGTVRHIKFGRVAGMSSRAGDTVLLRDILNEAKAITLDSLTSRSTTKVTKDEDLAAVAERLAVDAVIIQDLKEYRKNNYRFSWDRMLNFSGDTGIFLHYTHARLNSLLTGESDVLSSVDVDYDLLTEEPAQRLIQHLARYDEVLLRSYSELEPCHLVQYLFMIGRLVNVAHDELYVRDQPSHIAKARLVLYESAKTVLANGMRILGLHPLDRL